MSSEAFMISLASMTCLGVGWFLAGRISKQLSPLSSTFLFQAAGLPFFLFLFPFNPTNVDSVNITGLIGVGIFDAFIMLLVFKAMREGDISIVAPIIDSYGLPAFILGILFLGETSSPVKLTAAGIIVAGIAFLSTDMTKLKHIKLEKGVFLAAVASVGIGIYLLWVSVLARTSGWFYTALIIRIAIAGSAFLLLIANNEWNTLRRIVIPWKWIIPGALLDLVGFSLFNYAVTIAESGKVSVITSAQTLIIVALSVIFLKEKMTRYQVAGAIGVVSGIMLLNL